MAFLRCDSEKMEPVSLSLLFLGRSFAVGAFGLRCRAVAAAKDCLRSVSQRGLLRLRAKPIIRFAPSVTGAFM